MKNTVISNIKQAVCSRAFWIGAFAFALLIFLSSMEEIMEAFREGELLPNGFHGALIAGALASDTITLALPVICALPYTASFVDDVKSGFLKSYLLRTTKRGYIAGKITGCALSGGLIFVAGVLLAYGVSALVFTPMEAALQAGGTASGAFVEVLDKIALFFFSGAFWSLLGMTLASMTGSKYMAYASPFIVYYVFIILKERYFSGLYVLYPKEWLNPSELWVFGNVSVLILLAELIAIISIGFACVVKRRLEQI